MLFTSGCLSPEHLIPFALPYDENVLKAGLANTVVTEAFPSSAAAKALESLAVFCTVQSMASGPEQELSL